MKFEIDGIEIKENQLIAIGKLKASLEPTYGAANQLDFSSIQYKVSSCVIEKLVDKLILEKGAEVLKAISKEQLINSVLMRFATKFTEQR